MIECLWQQNAGGSDGKVVSAEGGRPVVGRVLHVVNGEHYAGAERVQDLLGGALPWFGYDVAFACLKPGQFSEARKNAHVPLSECRMQGRLDLRPVRLLVRLVREGGYRLLHAHTPRSLMLASVASVVTRTPLVYHVHSPAVADSTNRVRNWSNGFLERLSLVRATHLITVSNSLRERYLSLGFSPNRITVVSNGVSCGTRLPMRKRSDGDPVVFGMTALFRPRKGLEVLLQSVADLLADGQRLRLRAIGQFETPEYEGKIKRLVAELGVEAAIDWTGFSSNIALELAQIDCFVLPSLFGEGLPMVILEAMAAGRPVIATDVEGAPEAIRHAENGLLAKANDPASLAQMMRQVMDGSVDLPALAERAAEDQRERFSVCSMARGVAGIYDRILGIAGTSSPQTHRETPCATSAFDSREASKPGRPLVPVDGVTLIPELPV